MPHVVIGSRVDAAGNAARLFVLKITGKFVWRIRVRVTKLNLFVL